MRTYFYISSALIGLSVAGCGGQEQSAEELNARRGMSPAGAPPSPSAETTPVVGTPQEPMGGPASGAPGPSEGTSILPLAPTTPAPSGGMTGPTTPAPDGMGAMPPM